MDNIGTAVVQVLQQAANPTPSLPSKPPGARPPLLDRTTDYEIPARVWSNWKPEFGPRSLRRELTRDERAAVALRAEAIGCAMVPFTSAESDLVDGAIHGLLAGFRSGRPGLEGAEAMAEVTKAVLRKFPAWAIVAGCQKIVRGEIEGLSRDWAPSDRAIHDVVADIVRPYQQVLDNARALLAAPVEPPEPPRLTREEIEAKLGRSVKDGARVHKISDEPEADAPRPDGKHAQRVAADLAARAARRQAQQEAPHEPQWSGE